MIDLTEHQVRSLQTEEKPIRVRDPQSDATYVLVRSDLYERIKGLLTEDNDNQLVRDMYPQVMKIFGRDGWDDPSMDIYNDLDPRLQK